MSDPLKLRLWFPSLSDGSIDQLEKFGKEIERFNPKLNLVSPAALARLDSDHFFDSVCGVGVALKDTSFTRVFDFGSGNGFPGIVGSICHPELEWNLVESDMRKSEFLKYIKSTLGLNNMSVLNERVESLPEGSVHAAISRGFAPLDKALILTGRCFSPGGVFYHFKGPQWSKELSKIPPQVFSRWSVKEKGSYSLPDDKAQYFIIETTKI